jgi:hypothetical protein
LELYLVSQKFPIHHLLMLDSILFQSVWHVGVLAFQTENVRRLDVSMNDPLLVRVLNRAADLHEEVEPLLGGEITLVAVLGDADATHQFHHEVRPAGGYLRSQI